MQWRDAHKCRAVGLSRLPHHRPCVRLPDRVDRGPSLLTLRAWFLSVWAHLLLPAGCREDQPADVRMLRLLHHSRGEMHDAQHSI